ncbi:MAG: RNA polymerase sigma factor [Nitrospinota bacterium]
MTTVTAQPVTFDDALLERLQAGEETAFSELVDGYGKRLYNYVFRLTQDKADAEDMLQETFLRAVRSIGNFRGQAKLGTWLYRIATNVFLSAQRRRKAEPKPDEVHSLDQLWEAEQIRRQREVPDETHDPSRQIQTRQETERLWQAVDALPENYRAALTLRDVEGRSAAETAEILGISVAAVKSRLHRARLTVRQALREA